MNEFISPNNEAYFGANDSETIQSAISAACDDGCRKIVIPRYNARTDKNEWRIPVSIKIPSNFTVILDNCYMVQETGIFDYMFCNEHAYSKTERDVNISLIGEGNAVLSGGVHNGLFEKTSGKFGLPGVGVNNLIKWYDVDGLVEENLNIEFQRWWAINHRFCSNIKIRNINFSAIPHVVNMDGIDFRAGCNNISIENITGKTGDDCIAFTALGGNEMGDCPEGKNGDIHDVKVKNVIGDPTKCYIVRLLNHDGNKLYNFDIDTILDATALSRKIRMGASLCLGSPLYMQEKHCELGDDYNIKAKNITSRGRDVVIVNNTLKDSVISNAHNFDTGINLVGVGFNKNLGHTNLQNVTLDHFYFGAKQQEVCCSRQLDPTEYTGVAFDFRDCSGEVNLKDVYIDKVRTAVRTYGGLKVKAENFNMNVVGNVCELQDTDSKLYIDGEEITNE